MNIGKGRLFYTQFSPQEKYFFCLQRNGDGKAIFLPGANRLRRRRLETSAQHDKAQAVGYPM
jgi:hypothetical protein